MSEKMPLQNRSYKAILKIDNSLYLNNQKPKKKTSKLVIRPIQKQICLWNKVLMEKSPLTPIFLF